MHRNSCTQRGEEGGGVGEEEGLSAGPAPSHNLGSLGEGS